MEKKHFWRHFWRLFKPYWVSEERTAAWTLLAAVVALTLGTVYINVKINEWQGDFYNNFQIPHKADACEKQPQGSECQMLKKERVTREAEFYKLIWRFTYLAFAFVIMVVYRQFLQQLLQIRWRRWMTGQFLDKWLNERAHYRMQLTDRGTDNPDQRVAEDLNIFAGQTLSLFLGLLNALVTLVSFVGILWVLSGAITLAGIRIPGYMVWVAVVYCIVGSYIAHLIGRPLIALSFNQQRYEADFRFSLVRFRENTESIALYGGERREIGTFRERFQALWGNFRRVMTQQKRLNWFANAFGQAAIIFPYVVAAPRFFAGAIDLGALFRTGSAFNQVQGALSWFVDAYPQLAEWRATIDRLSGFEQAIERAGSVQAQPSPRRETADGLSVSSLDLNLPDGKPLMQGASFDVNQGDTMLVAGPSGSGKSTLFRAIAGIWPFGKGVIATPDPAHTLFLPQKPYLPIGTLREVVSFPAKGGQFPDADIRTALEDCKLAHLVTRLNESQNWALQLSPGEQQRLSFARVLLIKPRWVFLDEATSALDEATETHMYELLQRLSGITIVSIGHRPSLRRFHKRRIDLVPGDAGAGRLVEAT
jgi:putative ATP-binding cassette transporter